MGKMNLYQKWAASFRLLGCGSCSPAWMSETTDPMLTVSTSVMAPFQSFSCNGNESPWIQYEAKIRFQNPCRKGTLAITAIHTVYLTCQDHLSFSCCDMKLRVACCQQCQQCLFVGLLAILKDLIQFHGHGQAAKWQVWSINVQHCHFSMLTCLDASSM